MYNLDYDTVSKGVQQCVEKAAKLKPEPLYFYPYIKRVLRQQWDVVKPQYPMTIKIPKDNEHLMAKDYEPAQTIVIEKPIMLPDDADGDGVADMVGATPMWFEESGKEAFFRLGYVNMDARKITDYRFDNEYIHMFLGGASGQGKSVTINSMLAGMFYEYAPWELEVHMSDAKINEFKKYGIGPHIPHITTIAATGDSDYVLSVLYKAKDEMMERGKIFGSLGVSNLKEFRKKTGLCYPRVLVVMDEVESTFKFAGKRAGEIADLIDAFARLGRAAGYHLFLATQNLTSDIPKSAIGQFRIRGCMGAVESVSQAVLGNSAATDNYGKVGTLIMNTEVLAGGNTLLSNTRMQTPYLTDDNFAHEMKELCALGREYGFERHLSFYDEEDIKCLEEYHKTVDTILAKKGSKSPVDVIPIGYPGFVTTDPDGQLKIELDHKDIENICILSSIRDSLCGHLSNVSYALHAQGYFIQLLCNAPDDFKEYVHGATVVEARTAETGPLPSIAALVKKRLLLLTIDQMAEGATYDRAAVEAQFEKDGVGKEFWGNELLCKRAVAYTSIRNSDSLSKEWVLGLNAMPNLKAMQLEYQKYQASIRPLQKSDFSKAAFFIGDMSKILGYGRENKMKCTDTLKLAMQDASRVNVVIVTFSRSMADLNGLATAYRYIIFDNPDTRDWARMRAEEPTSNSDVLAVLFDNLSTGPLMKFKRTLLHPKI